MIKALRKRARPDTLKNQIRAGGKSLARRVYFYSVAILAVTLVWSFTGHWFFLDAEGIVTKERVVVAPDYQARVAEIGVRPGDQVAVGARLATLQSREMIDSLADLTSRRAQTLARLGQIEAREETIRDILPIAEERLRRARGLMDQLDGSATSEQTSDLSQRRAQTLARKGQVDSQLRTLASTQASAEDRLRRARDRLQQMRDLMRRGLTTAPRMQEAEREFYDAERLVATQNHEREALNREAEAVLASLADIDAALGTARQIATAPRQAEAQREAYEAQRETATLRTEAAALARERATLVSALNDMSRAIAQVEASYRGGAVIAAVAGTVGPRVPHLGHVVKAGEPLLELYSGPMFVYAYLPTGRLYSVQAGDAVRVSDGQRTERGRIERIEPVTDALPPEFQMALKTSTRFQLVRIVFDDPVPYPILAKVQVTGAWSPQGVVSAALGLVRQGGAAVHDALRAAGRAIGGSPLAVAAP